jgi:TolB-like protein/AraC-like DNA-binding protein/cytochrome c-type biogenesis protein CcmH/NrfG
MQADLSIAVLPFKNMSSDQENEYFCDGITEEIINALAKIQTLKVTSRTSSFHFKNKEIPISQIADKLGVATILEGSVRLSGDTIRITAQLIQAEEDFHFWSETWDRKRDKIFEIQDEVSLAIAEKIRENFGHFEIVDHLVKKQTDNMNAYEYSLLAQFHKNKWNPDDCKVAEELFQKSLELDPKHVASIVGLGDVYSFLGMVGVLSFHEAWTKCNDLIDKALEIDPENPEAYYQKGHSAFFTECDYSKALRFASKAVKLKPNYVEAQQLLSFLHVLAGNSNQAKEHLEIALGIDPLSQETLFFKAYFDYMTNNYASAYDQLMSCLEVNPKNIPAHAVVTLCLLKLRRYDEVVNYFEDLEVEVAEGEKYGSIALAYAFKKDRENTEKYTHILREMANSTDGFTADSYLFMLYAVTGEKEKAFGWIEDGIKNKSTLLLLRFPDPIVEDLRLDERYAKFQSLLFHSALFEASKSVKKALLTKSLAKEYRLKLLSYLEENEPFLDANLTLKSLASQIEIHPNKLSWLINDMREQNFNQFINKYRIEHFKKLAIDPINSQFSILGLAYDSGFNSKTVFNTSFKKSVGMSPKAWIEAQ